MVRKKKQKAAPAPEKPAVASFNQPFGALASLKKNLTAKPRVETPAVPAPTPPPPGDESLFLAEMADVAPLTANDKRRPKVPPPAAAWKAPELPDEDMEVLRSLTDLVSGKAEFDLTYTSEYVEAQTRGLPPVLMERLRAGRIPFQDHLDLHGYNLIQAEAAVTSFILDSASLGRGCVLLIHGRGLGSKDGIPVLKRNLEAFLLRGVVRKYILAFTTARPIDGGLGASYILLRA
ncbi:MAG: Smr/MutS family protein [Candidatus Adiutrix sp.]|jgi:DNA-nicking Smr family endonuclease|nr:Smr/MutS family protein [Candidatus Adiutrix sp.]